MMNKNELCQMITTCKINHFFYFVGFLWLIFVDLTYLCTKKQRR